MGTFVPFFIILSISSFPPTPVSRQIIASLIYGIRIRLAKNPGESAERLGILPMRFINERAAATVLSEVWRPVMISTPFWTGTGFMKCVEMTREAAERLRGSFFVAVEAAMRVMEMDEVFVARMASGGQIWARREKMENFKSGISFEECG
jgi:hypothetical protein